MGKKICLVDGSGYIFRAFYGLPPMTAPDGTPVNAVYGFTNMFMKLTAKFDCDYNLVLFDAKRQNFRNEIFTDYKATRKEIPEDLIPQFPIIREAVDALKLNHLEIEGYEADDLIATYTSQALDAGMEVIIVSGDKDLMQLIRKGVSFYDPMKDKFFTPEDVKEKFGVYPELVPDVQALSGDSTDNVPGVPGIGPKTAAELVNTYGSLNGVLEHAAEIKQNKRRETLLANIENAKISLQLVTLKPDVPVEHSAEYYAFHCPDLSIAEAFVNKYGFTSLKLRIAKWVEEQCKKDENFTSEPKKEIKTEYKLITSVAELKNWLQQAFQYQQLALKVFATGLHPVFDKAVGVALTVCEGESVYIPLISEKDNQDTLDLFITPQTKAIGLSADEMSECLLPVLNSPMVLKIGHNIKLDMHFLNQITKNCAKIVPYDDISVISCVLDSTNHGHSVSELSQLFLDYKMQNPDVVFGVGKQKTSPEKTDVNIVAKYMGEQTDMIVRLWQILRPRLLSEHMVTVYEHFDRPLITTLYEMEKNGVMINAQQLKDFSAILEQRQKQTEQEIFVLASEEFNLGSPKQVGEILYNKLGLSGKKHSGTGSFQTGAEVLEQMAEEHPLPAKILDWRAISKLKTTYTDTLLQQLDKNSRIHTTYDQTNVNTGRLSSNNPNLQNIPIRSEDGQKIRSCFVAKEGCKLISADYSQVELRLLAVLADVKALKEAFAQGIDVHTATAMRVFGLSEEEVTPDIRRHAKAINFGVIYGISQYGLAKQIGVSPAEAKGYIDAYFAKMPEIKTFMEKTIVFARKNGFVVTPFGRKCAVSGINEKNQRVSSFAERTAMNAPLQGGAADIMKRAMNNMHRELVKGGYQAKILLQVHDEMIVEAPENEVEAICILLKKTMENAVDYDVKFVAEVGVGDNWTQAH